MSRARRAKKVGSFKGKIVLMVLIICIASIYFVFQDRIKVQVSSLMGVKTEIYGLNDYVNDRFTLEDGKKYIPIVYDTDYTKVTKSDIKAKFKQRGITVRNNLPDKIVNGTVVETSNGNYTVLIYGDVNCDGEVNVYDAQRVVEHIVYEGEYTLTGVSYLAANVNKENNSKEINVYDAQKIVEFIVGYSKIIDSLPKPDNGGSSSIPTYTSPKITLAVEGDIKLNVEDENTVLKYDTEDVEAEGKTLIDLSATVTDDYDKNLKAQLKITNEQGEEVKEIDINKPEVYTLKYIATNSKGKTTVLIRKVEIIDYIVKIEKSSEDTKISKLQYHEGEKIELAGAKVKLTTKAGVETEKDLAELMQDADYSYTLSPSDEGNLAKYQEQNTYKLSVTVIYTNPSKNATENNKTVNSALIEIGEITVTGYIRNFESAQYKDVSNKQIYSEFEIATLKSKEGQDTLQEKYLTYSVTRDDVEVDKSEYEINSEIAEETATVKFWGRKAGTYKIVITADSSEVDDEIKATSSAIDITLSEDKTVDAVSPVLTSENKLYNGLLIAGGKPVDIEVVFSHKYTIPGTQNIELVPVSVSKDKLTGKAKVIESTERSDMKDVSLTYKEDNEGVKYISVTAGKDAYDAEKTQGEIEVYVEQKKIETIMPKGSSEESITIEVNSPSEYSLLFTDNEAFSNNELTLVLDENKVTNNQVKTSNMIYTLVKAVKQDQYGYQYKVKANELSTEENTKTDTSKITFVDGGKVIDVKGFTADKKVCESETEIDYVGFALSGEDSGDEDVKLEKAGSKIEIYDENENSTPDKKINVKLIKKDITSIINTSKTEQQINGFCFDKITVAKIKSGPKQEPLTKDNLKDILELNEENEFKITKEDGTEFTLKNEYDEFKEYLKAVPSKVEDGVVEVVFETPEVGTYKVEIKLKDDKAEEKKITTQSIVVTENYEVTSVNFEYKDLDKPDVKSTEFGSVRKEKTKRYSVLYYHDYKEGEKTITTREIKDAYAPTNDQITFDVDEASKSHVTIDLLKDGTKIAKSEKEQHENVDGFEIILDNNTTSSTIPVTMKIGSNFSLKGQINVKEKAKIEKVSIKDMKGNDTEELHLYTNTDGNNGDETVVKVKGNVQYCYTLYKLSFIDEDNDLVPVKKSQITNVKSEDKISFMDGDYYNTNEHASPKIHISGFKHVTGDDYVEMTSDNDEITYVGISLDNEHLKNSVKSVVITWNGKFVTTLGEKITLNMLKKQPIFTLNSIPTDVPEEEETTETNTEKENNKNAKNKDENIVFENNVNSNIVTNTEINRNENNKVLENSISEQNVSIEMQKEDSKEVENNEELEKKQNESKKDDNIIYFSEANIVIEENLQN